VVLRWPYSDISLACICWGLEQEVKPHITLHSSCPGAAGLGTSPSPQDFSSVWRQLLEIPGNSHNSLMGALSSEMSSAGRARGEDEAESAGETSGLNGHLAWEGK
jgi:hypothetical protein